MKKLSSVFLCLSIIMASCNDESEDTKSSDGLSINAYIGQAHTRAEKTDWVENDALGVFVCDGTIDKPYLGNSSRYFNVSFRHNGKGFFAQNVFLDESLAEVFAYFPYSAASMDGEAIPVESNTQTDYLLGHSETPASISHKAVSVEMKHALSQVVFKIRKADSYNEGPGILSSLKIENNDTGNTFKTTGTLNLSTGTITGTSTDGILTLMPGEQLVLNGDYQSVASICLPVNSTPGKNVRAVFTIDERQFRYEFPANTTWSAGFRNIYTLTVTNSSIDIGGDGSGDGGSDDGITIEPWGANADSDISLVPIL